LEAQIKFKNRVHRKQLNNKKTQAPAVAAAKRFSISPSIYALLHSSASETSLCEVWLVPRAHFSHTPILMSGSRSRDVNRTWKLIFHGASNLAKQHPKSPSIGRLTQLHQLLLCGGEKDIATFDGALFDK
jgi:hypothetical protein